MNMNDLSAREYIKQMWFNYPTLFDSKFAVLHSIFSKGISVESDGSFGYCEELPEIREKFKRDFQDYQTELERSLIDARLSILENNMDAILDGYLPKTQSDICCNERHYIVSHYVYHVSEYSGLFSLTANVRKDWLEAALEMAEYWIAVLHSWNYYHPTDTITKDMVKLRDKCDEICVWLNRSTKSERDKMMCDILNEILKETE